MNVVTYSAFRDEMEKIGSPLVHGLEVAGLATLAKPGIDKLRSKKSTTEERKHAKWETAGLGVLAAHPAYELGKAGLGALKRGGLAAAKHASVETLIKRAAVFGGGSGMRAAMTDAAHMAQRGIQGRGAVAGAAQGVAKMTHKLDPAMSMVPGGKFLPAAAPARMAAPAKLTGMDKIRAAQQAPIK